MTLSHKYITLPILALIAICGGAVLGYTHLGSAAQDIADIHGSMQGMMGGFATPHVDGTITAIDGSTITITADQNHGGGTFKIDTSNATFTKDGASSSIGDYKVVDRVWAGGSINGTDVSATAINNSRGGKGMMGHGGMGKGHGVVGTVESISGSTVTVKGIDSTTYTVETKDASVERKVVGSLSDVKVGDQIGVHGTLSGTNVTATHIMDDISVNR
jgi:hypothetical protein